MTTTTTPATTPATSSTSTKRQTRSLPVRSKVRAGGLLGNI